LPTVLARSKACQRILKLCLITAQRFGEVTGLECGDLRPGWSVESKFHRFH
jgi:hypothetical protein